MISKHLQGVAIAGAILLPLAAPGCGGGDDPRPCCTEFRVGGQIGADMQGGPPERTAVQAVADYAAIAAASVEGLTTLCRAVAEDLGVSGSDRDVADAKPDRRERLIAVCTLAVGALRQSKTKAGGTLALVAPAPACATSVSLRTACQSRCADAEPCDVNVEANRPRCPQGKLQVGCSGSCRATTGASVACEGRCIGTCNGACTVATGVRCKGRCDGTCTAQASPSGLDFDPQGNCVGTCLGTCSAPADGVTCEGLCNGECAGACESIDSAAAICDGTCDAPPEPLRCEGGKLEGGCPAPPKCNASCDAIVTAKAECAPPRVEVAFANARDVTAGTKLAATLRANFGSILAYRSRLTAMQSTSATIRDSAGAVQGIKPICVTQVVRAALDAATDVDAAAAAAESLDAAVRT
jgi:hypothetical protein